MHTKQYWIVLTLISALVSMFLAKSQYGHVAKQAVTSGSVICAVPALFRRNLGFGRYYSGAASNKAETDWTETGQNGDGAGSAHESLSNLSASSSAVSSTSYNYDKASFEKLISYHVAVAYEPKNRKHSNIFKQNRTKTPAELSPSGEDNLFVTHQISDGHFAVGVADGVGGWSDAGYDSSAISRELCHFMKTTFEDQGSQSSLSPRDILKSAFSKVQASPKVEIGGTTACVGVFTPENKLRVSNLGDSWCGVFRNFKCVQETAFQTHNFNTPYQLSKIPQHIVREAEKQGRRYISNTPDDCDDYEWQLQADDIVIFATDGVTDNVVTDDMGRFLKDQFDSGKSLDHVSSKFVQEVFKVSKDKHFPSAFSQELSRLTGQKYLGGKEDDITVVMVKVL